MFNAPTFNDQHPHVQRSTFNLQPSTFNLQRSTFNAQRSTTNAPTFNLQPSTFNIQRPTFNAPTFPRFNVQPSHAQRPNLHPSPIVYRLSFIGYRLSAIVYRLSSIGYRLSAIVYRLSSIGYRLSAIGYDQPSTAINTHPPAHVGAPDPHSSETQDRAAAPGSWRSGYRAQARQGHIPGDQPVQ
jgi:hypothetical protein